MINNNIVSFEADGAITEYALVSRTTAGKVSVTTASNDSKCIGIAQRACADGERVEVVISGLSRVIVGTAGLLSSDSLVMATTAGTVVAHADSTSYSIGQIIPNINQFSASANDQILIKFTGPQNLLP